MTKANAKIDAIIWRKIKQLDLMDRMIMDALNLAEFVNRDDQAVNRAHRIDLTFRIIKDVTEITRRVFDDLKSHRSYFETEAIKRGTRSRREHPEISKRYCAYVEKTIEAMEQFTARSTKTSVWRQPRTSGMRREPTMVIRATKA